MSSRKRSCSESVSRVNVPTLSFLAKMKTPASPRKFGRGDDEKSTLETQDLSLQRVGETTATLPIADLAKFFAKVSLSIPSLAATKGQSNDSLTEAQNDSADNHHLFLDRHWNQFANAKDDSLNISISLGDLMEGYQAFERLTTKAISTHHTPERTKISTVTTTTNVSRPWQNSPTVEEPEVKPHFSRRGTSPVAKRRSQSASPSPTKQAHVTTTNTDSVQYSSDVRKPSIKSPRPIQASKSKNTSPDRHEEPPTPTIHSTQKSMNDKDLTPSSPIDYLDEVLDTLETQITRSYTDLSGREMITESLKDEIGLLRARNWELLQETLRSADQQNEAAKVHEEWRFALENVITSLAAELQQEKAHRLEMEQQLVQSLEKLKASVSKLLTERQELVHANSALQQRYEFVKNEGNDTKRRCQELRDIIESQKHSISESQIIIEERDFDIASNKRTANNSKQEWKSREVEFQTTIVAKDAELSRLKDDLISLRQQIKIREETVENKVLLIQRLQREMGLKNEEAQEALQSEKIMLDETFQKLQHRQAQLSKQDANQTDNKRQFTDWVAEMQRSMERRERALADDEAKMAIRQTNLNDEMHSIALRTKQLDEWEKHLKDKDRISQSGSILAHRHTTASYTNAASKTTTYVASHHFEATQVADKTTQGGRPTSYERTTEQRVQYDAVHPRQQGLTELEPVRRNMEAMTPNSLSRSGTDYMG